MKSLNIVVLLLLVFLPVLAFAQHPIAEPGTEGLRVIVSNTDNIIATYLGNSAAYSNDLYFGLTVDDADTFLFNNHNSPVGSQVDMGSFPVGTELVFRLHVNNTGDDFFTGPGERNADQQPHARVQEEWQPGEALVSFEDLLNGPFVYNDLSFSFTNTATSVLVCDAGGPYFGSAGVELEFDGSGSSASNSEIIDYSWDFGDGNQGNGMVVNHTYQTDGNYEVTLCITDDDGQTSCCSPESGSVVPTQSPSFDSLKSYYR